MMVGPRAKKLKTNMEIWRMTYGYTCIEEEKQRQITLMKSKSVVAPIRI